MSNDDDDKQVILCQPTAWAHGGHVEGSVQIIADCGHEVWAAPTTMDLIHTGVESMCLGCLGHVPEVKEHIQKHGIGMTQEQQDEVAGEIGRDAVAELIHSLGIKKIQ